MKTFLSIFNAYPAVLQSVQAVEAAVPGHNNGKQKLDMILGAAATAWALSQAEQQFSQGDTLNAIQAMTNLTVAALNATGVFKKQTPVSSN